jgi:hypothetical protein
LPAKSKEGDKCMKKLNPQLLNDITGGPGLLPNLFGNLLGIKDDFFPRELEFKTPLHQGINEDLVKKVLGNLEPAKLGAPKLGRRNNRV